jgi:putative oxidoreductase
MTAGALDFGAVADVTLAIRLALGIVFAAAGLAKLRDVGGFIQTVRDYAVLPDRAAAVVAPLVIATELGIAVCLLGGVMVTVALIAALLCLTAFLVAVVVNLHRKRVISCGCFGGGSETISLATVARLTVLIAATLLLAIASVRGVQQVRLVEIWRGGWSGLAFALDVLALSSFLALTAMWLLHAHLLVRVAGGGRPAEPVSETGEGRSRR